MLAIDGNRAAEAMKLVNKLNKKSLEFKLIPPSFYIIDLTLFFITDVELKTV